MRILIANWHRNVLGGAEKYIQSLLPGLLARGHQVALVCEWQADREREIVDAGLSIPVFCSAELQFPNLMPALDHWQPDVVYIQGMEGSDLHRALLDRYAGVLFAHNYGGTCATGTKCHGFPQPRPCHRRFGLMCLVLHYPRQCGGLNPSTAWRSFRRESERNRNLSCYRAIIVGSRHMQQEFLQHGIPPTRIHLVPLPAADTPLLPVDLRPRTPNGHIILLGRLTNLKGGSYLIPAVASASVRIGPLTLTIVGDGPDRQKLEDLSRRFHVSTTFVPWIPAAEKARLLREADLVAVPSLWPEPFGLTGIEAGQMGIPAVGFQVGGIPDWLIPGYSGELAPGDPPTVHGLTEAIVRALADPDHYEHLCRGAREVAGRFTLERHLDGLEPVLAAAARFPAPLAALPTGVQHPL